MSQETPVKRQPSRLAEGFIVRESLITAALRDPNHRACYKYIEAMAIIVLGSTLVQYMFDRKVFHSDMAFLGRCFSHIHTALVFEAGGLIVCCALVPSVRMRRQSSTVIVRLIHAVAVAVTCSLIVAVPLYIRKHYAIHPVLGIALVMQMARFLMKIVSFLSENSASVNDIRISINGANNTNGKTQTNGEWKPLLKTANNNSNNNNNISEMDEKTYDAKGLQKASQQLPTLKSFVYFMFAPTLLYRHSYPRSAKPTNWFKVAGYLLQWVYFFAPTTIVFNRIATPLYKDVGRIALTVDHLHQLFLLATLTYPAIIYGVGFCFLHCWLNMWSEILRFGDREFYKNWWSAKNSFQFLSLWNTMIQSWIVAYVYVPCIRLTRNRLQTIACVMLLSAMIHDYMFSFSAGFIVPFTTIAAISLIFMSPLLLIVNHARKSMRIPMPNENWFLSGFLFAAIASMASGVEFMCRLNCPDPSSSFMESILIPRSYSCLTFNFTSAP